MNRPEFSFFAEIAALALPLLYSFQSSGASHPGRPPWVVGPAL